MSITVKLRTRKLYTGKAQKQIRKRADSSSGSDCNGVLECDNESDFEL